MSAPGGTVVINDLPFQSFKFSIHQASSRLHSWFNLTLTWFNFKFCTVFPLTLEQCRGGGWKYWFREGGGDIPVCFLGSSGDPSKGLLLLRGVCKTSKAFEGLAWVAPHFPFLRGFLQLLLASDLLYQLTGKRCAKQVLLLSFKHFFVWSQNYLGLLPVLQNFPSDCQPALKFQFNTCLSNAANSCLC